MSAIPPSPPHTYAHTHTPVPDITHNLPTARISHVRITPNGESLQCRWAMQYALAGVCTRPSVYVVALVLGASR